MGGFNLVEEEGEAEDRMSVLIQLRQNDAASVVRIIIFLFFIISGPDMAQLNQCVTINCKKTN